MRIRFVAAATAHVVVADPTMRSFMQPRSASRAAGHRSSCSASRGVGRRSSRNGSTMRAPGAEEAVRGLSLRIRVPARARKMTLRRARGQRGSRSRQRARERSSWPTSSSFLSRSVACSSVLRAQTTEPVRAKPEPPTCASLPRAAAICVPPSARAEFDDELYALVSTSAMRIPPLRERALEIPALADHLLRQIAEPLGVPPPSVTPEAAKLLCAYSWLRNIGDLRERDGVRAGPVGRRTDWARRAPRLVSPHVRRHRCGRVLSGRSLPTCTERRSGSRPANAPFVYRPRTRSRSRVEGRSGARCSLWRSSTTASVGRDLGGPFPAAGLPGDKSVAGSGEARCARPSGC